MLVCHPLFFFSVVIFFNEEENLKLNLISPLKGERESIDLVTNGGSPGDFEPIKAGPSTRETVNSEQSCRVILSPLHSQSAKNPFLLFTYSKHVKGFCQFFAMADASLNQHYMTSVVIASLKISKGERILFIYKAKVMFMWKPVLLRSPSSSNIEDHKWV